MALLVAMGSQTWCLTSWQVLVDGHLSLHGFAQEIGRGRAATSLLRGVSQGALLAVSLHPIPPELVDL